MMKVLHGKIGGRKNLNEDLCLTIGNFDGVHLGHQALIKACINSGYKSMVMTFDPHPDCVVKRDGNYHFLVPRSKKIELIRKLNPDYLFIIDFDIKGASKSKDDFINWLLKLGVKKIVCGKDYPFGHRASGDINDLKKHFEVVVLDNVLIDNERVSSTNIKKYLSLGNIERANLMLGRPYSIEGLVVHGSQIGIKLGFPTANIDIFGNTEPKKGVYAVMIEFRGKHYYGMANVGNNPTCNYQLNSRLEVHLFNFSGNLYSQNVNVHFLKYWREEQKFSSVEELIKQLNDDKERIKEWVLGYEG